MRIPVLSVLLLFISFFAVAQQRQYSTTNSEAIKNFALANQSLDEHLYDEAAQYLQKAIEADGKFIEANYVLGDVFRQMRNYKSSIIEYNKTIALNPDYNRAIYLRLGDEEIGLAQYNNALQHLQKYL